MQSRTNRTSAANNIERNTAFSSAFIPFQCALHHQHSIHTLILFYLCGFHTLWGINISKLLISTSGQVIISELGSTRYRPLEATQGVDLYQTGHIT